MPRPSAVRAPQTASRSTVGYHEDPDVAIIAGDLIRRHEARFWHLRQYRIGYVMVTGKDIEPGKRETAGKALKAPPLWQALTGFDAIVWILERVWNDLDSSQREALIAHELSHLGQSEQGKLLILPHDLEDFAWLVGQYGPWNPDIQLYGAQLRSYEARFEREAAEKPLDEEPAPENVTTLEGRGKKR